MSTATLDAKGLACPMPIVKTKKALKDLAVGETLGIEATDPGSLKDMEAFCKTTGHELVSSAEAGGVYVFEIKKSA
ncbi:MAG: sulfurtransferase TusA family protein [Rhodospirillales bacterium]|nr:sulfurtransferase TusA family protein [Rhodospirillales bacterium]